MKINKKILFLFLANFILFATIVNAAPAGNQAPSMVQAVQNAFVAIGGSIVVIGWIIAGILWLTSVGNPQRMETAKKALMAAVIGTVLIILAVGAEAFINNLLNNPANTTPLP